MKNITVKDIITATGGKLLSGDENTAVLCVAVDSRKVSDGALYVPVIGCKTDGHLYIDSAFKNGAAASLTSKDIAVLPPEKPLIRVDDTIKALQDIGRYLRSTMKMPVIGITGSVGKTTTREMISCALSGVMKVTSTLGNSNSQMGVPITLSLLDGDADAAVMEFGMSEPGEMSKIAATGRPDIAVITNIGVSHIENLGSQEAILAEKLHITDGFGTDGILLVNGDDPLLAILKGTLPFKTLTYGISQDCDIRAKNLSLSNGKSTFDVLLPEDLPLFGKTAAGCAADGGLYSDKADGLKVVLNTVGRHLVQNALAAIGVCAVLGCRLAACAKALGEFSGFSRRLEIKQMHGFTLIDDSYNASPDSMKAALDVLRDYESKGQKIAVLADMFELGSDSPLYHSQVGEYAVKCRPDAVITIGELSENIAAMTQKAGIKTIVTKSNEQAVCALRGILSRGDLVLLKGSNGMKLNEVADAAEEIIL